MENIYDVLIVGAGAAGLLAARLLSDQGKSVCILEARDRIGGRIHTLPFSDWGEHAQAGAEFIHGNLELTLSLLKEAGLKKKMIRGEMWQVFNGNWQQDAGYIDGQEMVIQKLAELKEDISISEFLATYFVGDENEELRQSLTSYIEGYYAGDIHYTSSKAFLEELQSEEEDQYRPADGYLPILNFFVNKIIEAGNTIKLSTIVKQIQFVQNQVEITDSDLQVYKAKKALITVPIGVWRAEKKDIAHISFIPALPQKVQAAHQLGYGSVIKILIQFNTPFWLSDSYKNKDIGFIFSDQEIGTWWTQNPRQSNILTGWLAGPGAFTKIHSQPTLLFEQAMESLQHIFSISRNTLSDLLTKWQVYNWTCDPFTLGAYSYSTLHTKNAINVLLQPVENTLFFAGEGLYNGTEMGTVEAAFVSGQSAAEQLLSSFN